MFSGSQRKRHSQFKNYKQLRKFIVLRLGSSEVVWVFVIIFYFFCSFSEVRSTQFSSNKIRTYEFVDLFTIIIAEEYTLLKNLECIVFCGGVWGVCLCVRAWCAIKCSKTERSVTSCSSYAETLHENQIENEWTKYVLIRNEARERNNKKKGFFIGFYAFIQVSTYVITVLWPFTYFAIRNKTNGIARVFISVDIVHFDLLQRVVSAHNLTDWFWTREKFEKLKDKKKTHFSFCFVLMQRQPKRKILQKQNTEFSSKKI